MSNLINGSLNLTRFSVGGEATEDEILFCLQSNKFIDITDSAEELSVGFTNFFDLADTQFNSIEEIKIDNFYVVGLRIDRRKIPATFFKLEVKKEAEKFLAEHPALKYVPKHEKEALRDRVRSRLLVGIPPAPTYCQIAWNTETKELLVGTRSTNVVGTVVALIHQSFPMLRIAPVTPIGRAIALISVAKSFNSAQTDSIFEQVEANTGLWQDFFAWLLYRAYNTDAHYQVTTTGPLLNQQPFIAYPDLKLVLSGAKSEGVQKMTILGAQDNLCEVKAAMRQGMTLDSIGLQLTLDSDTVISLVLDANWLAMSGAKIPLISPESDPNDDQTAEQIATFLVRMGSIDEVQQMLDSLVVRYLQFRDESWGEFSRRVKEWLDADV